MKIKYFILSSLILVSGISPVFAEVTQIQLDQEFYEKGDSINVTGKVTEDSSGLVNIVLRDPDGKFVLLSQAIILSDDSFEKTIPINEKFQILGTYNATAFVTNVTAGKIQSFDLAASRSEEPKEDQFSDVTYMEDTAENLNQDEPKITALEETQVKLVEPTIAEPKNTDEKESITLTEPNGKIADFVDSSKDPQYYLERYYNEPKYKSWFDRNYPTLTIEEAVGYNPQLDYLQEPKDTNAKIIQTAEASSIDTPVNTNGSNSDLAQIGLAIGGLAILLGAVYGIKRKVDSNSRHISFNKEIIKKKLISPIIDSNPLHIIQTRLAKGEITVEEYEILREKLEK